MLICSSSPALPHSALMDAIWEFAILQKSGIRTEALPDPQCLTWVCSQSQETRSPWEGPAMTKKAFMIWLLNGAAQGWVVFQSSGQDFLNVTKLLLDGGRKIRNNTIDWSHSRGA